MPDILCSVRDGTDIITAPAELDIYSYQSLREAASDPELVARGRLVIDLTGTTFMDSYGLGVLVGADRRIRAAEGAMAVACTREAVLKAFRITGMDGLLAIYDTVDEAVAAVKEASGG